MRITTGHSAAPDSGGIPTLFKPRTEDQELRDQRSLIARFLVLSQRGTDPALD